MRRKVKLTLREALERLAYIHAIASGDRPYSSDFGRLCTIERASDARRSLKRELREYAAEPKPSKR
jgi:hypothetical protein